METRVILRCLAWEIETKFISKLMHPQIDSDNQDDLTQGDQAGYFVGLRSLEDNKQLS